MLKLVTVAWVCKKMPLFLEKCMMKYLGVKGHDVPPSFVYIYTHLYLYLYLY